MQSKLWAHQERVLRENKDRVLLVHETGTGKTLIACRWIKMRPERKALVICPKSIVKKWRRDLKEEGAKAFVIKTDTVKTLDLSKYDCIVVDEAQNFASPLFEKGRSARSTALYNHLKRHPETHVMLCSATPIRSTPWNIHTLACYLQHLWPVKEFRDKFFYLTDLYGRYHYELKKDWRTMIRPYVEEIADIVLMKDCVDVPKQTDEVIVLEAPKLPASAIYRDPSSEWHARHREEQGTAKFKELQRILEGYRKAIVVCYYTEQIEAYKQALEKERAVFVLQGTTKDQDKVIADAKNADDCIFIIQASMGAGFDAAEFSVVIFASMSFRYVDYVQMRGRVKRINNLHENLFIHILAGKCDQAIYNKIMQGVDFDVHATHNL